MQPVKAKPLVFGVLLFEIPHPKIANISTANFVFSFQYQCIHKIILFILLTKRIAEIFYDRQYNIFGAKKNFLFKQLEKNQHKV